MGEEMESACPSLLSTSSAGNAQNHDGWWVEIRRPGLHPSMEKFVAEGVAWEVSARKGSGRVILCEPVVSGGVASHELLLSVE